MIDSVTFRVPGGNAPDLEQVTRWRDDFFRGQLGNLRVTQYPDGIACTGSLAVFLQGNNVLPLTRQGVEESLRKLETETGWELSRAVLTQIEVGTTLQVKNPPAWYLESWGPLPRFGKMDYRRRVLETVTYRTEARSFSGYDKRKQAMNSGQEIPALFSGAELIRLELKYKRGLRGRIGRVLTPWDLADRTTYSELVRRWQDFYFQIPKGRVPVIDTSGRISPRDVDAALKAKGLQVLGYDTVNGFIADLEARGKLGRVQADRARKALRESARDTRISEPDSLTDELDCRVREVSVFAR